MRIECEHDEVGDGMYGDNAIGSGYGDGAGSGFGAEIDADADDQYHDEDSGYGAGEGPDHVDGWGDLDAAVLSGDGVTDQKYPLDALLLIAALT